MQEERATGLGLKVLCGIGDSPQSLPQKELYSMRELIGTLFLLLVTMPQVQANPYRDACLADQERLCRQVRGKGAASLVACFAQHESELSRACIDYREMRGARS